MDSGNSNRPKTKLPVPSSTKLPQSTSASAATSTARRSLEDRTNDINQMPPPTTTATARGRSLVSLAGSRSTSKGISGGSSSNPSSRSRSTSRDSNNNSKINGGLGYNRYYKKSNTNSAVNASSFMAPKQKKLQQQHEIEYEEGDENYACDRQQQGEQAMRREDSEKQELLHAEIRRLKTELSSYHKISEELADTKQALDFERESKHQYFNEKVQPLLDSRDNRISKLEQQLEESRDKNFKEVSELKAQLADVPSEIKKKLYEEFEQERSLIRQRAEEDVQTRQKWELESLQNKHEMEISNLTSKLESEHEAKLKELYNEYERQFNDATNNLEKKHTHEMASLKQAADEKVNELEDTIHKIKMRHAEESQNMELKFSQERTKISQEYDELVKEKKSLMSDIDDYKDKLASQKHETDTLRSSLEELSASSVSYESISKSQQDQINELQSQLQGQKDKVSELRSLTQQAENKRDEAKDKLLKEELIRRKLHNQIQELKGNIRVFCRVRPKLESEQQPSAEIQYPDRDLEGQKILLTGLNSSSDTTLTTTPKLQQFSFDRVFSPESTNDQVFDEISQLVQSALDGYNVCIFAYGQTGSGKTYTMSTPNDGMISRAINQIFQTADSLKEKGWEYNLDGQFLEIYNENLNDLLGKADMMDKSKLDIRHDDTKMKTTVTNVTEVTLDSPQKVEFVLKKAWDNRAVASTKVNERSSRSHSVFILKLTGYNNVTGDKSEGVLNLIDLAGSERLSQSHAAGDRLKETQAINKSLSSLGDVIQALGGSREHVPYRNSKVSDLLSSIHEYISNVVIVDIFIETFIKWEFKDFNVCQFITIGTAC